MRIVLCKGQILGPISGADETLVTYSIQLQKAGHSVSVLLMYLPSIQDQYYQRLVNAGIEVTSIASKLAHTYLGTGRKLAYKMFAAFPSYKRLIRRKAQHVVTGLAERYVQHCRDYFKQKRADLIHIITPDPSAMVMIRAGYEVGIPVIYQELGMPYHPPDFESYYQQFASVLPLCTEVAALSPRLAEHCRERLPPLNKLSVLPITSDEVRNGNPANKHTNGHLTFGFAARMETLKGPMVLMEAFGATHQRSKNVYLKIAGDGSQKENVSALAKSLNVTDNYSYCGVYAHPDARTAFMHDIDVFVMPSFTEGTPNSIIEAMANGRPIIASSVGGIPDMIDKESGILVPPGDAKALAKAMLELAEDGKLRQRMGQAAHNRYQELFSPKAVVPLMLETYRRVADSSHLVDSNGNSHPWRSID